MLRSQKMRDYVLTIIIEGYGREQPHQKTIDFFCDKVIGINNGKATSTGVFTNAEVKDCPDDGSKAMEYVFRASYQKTDYGLSLKTYQMAVIFHAEKKNKRKLPDQLYKSISSVVKKHIRSINRESHV